MLKGTPALPTLVRGLYFPVGFFANPTLYGLQVYRAGYEMRLSATFQ
jgi:hypothetical protein